MRFCDWRLLIRPNKIPLRLSISTFGSAGLWLPLVSAYLRRGGRPAQSTDAMVRLFTGSATHDAVAVWARRTLRVLLGVAVVVMVVPVWAASFSATVDRQSLLVGETANFSLTFEDCQPQRVPVMPNVPNLQFQYLGPSSQQTIINGQQKSTTTLKFALIPQQPGDYVIPALKLELDGHSLSTQPLKLQVLREDPAAPPATLANAAAFLWPVWPRRECFPNEVLILEMRLYLRAGVAFGDFQFPPLTADGIQSSQLSQGGDFQRAVAGVPFRVIPLYAALTPSRLGALELGPLQGSITMNAREWPDFDSFFSRRPPPQRVPLSLDRQEFRVLPLPTNNVPASFNGAVGSFELKVSAGPTNVTVGDPITVRIQLAGHGAFDALTLPEQRAWKDFKTYSATSKVETKPPLGVEGMKLFEQVIAPQNAELNAIPPVEFSFFDPVQKTYRTLKSAPVGLTVRGAATVAPVIAAGKPATEDNAPPAQDIVGLKQHLGTLAAVQGPLPLRPAFWALQAVPVLAWVGAVLWRRRADALANNPRLHRRKQVAQVVNDGLAELRKLAGQKQSEAFFATLFRVLQEQIGERLDLPASAITEAIVDERLKPGGLAETACASLHELFQTCNFARYAPVQSSQELAAIVPRVETVIEQLRRFEA